MVKVLMHHKVADFSKWKNAFESFHEKRKAAGELAYSVGTLHGQPEVAYVIQDWSSKEAFDSFLSNPTVSETMQASGVMELPNVVVLDEHNNGVN